jgi:regulator of ribosome biosynthesis
MKPPPPPKQETKWEKFARERGLPLNKEKRSRKVWDETAGEWKYRHGYEKANKNDKEWPIMEVKASEDPFDDPWERARDAKRTRTDKNVENRMRNEERTGGLAKGTTNRVLKSRERSRTEGKIGGNMDRDNVLPTGVPVDLKAAQKRGKDSTLAALAATQRSTASLGQFDQMRQGEPERRKALAKLKKRKFELATDKKVIATEGEKSMKILNTVVNGGGVAKEKAKRKGMLAKGETAYDYDYDDGLGPSTFKKKKVRRSRYSGIRVLFFFEYVSYTVLFFSTGSRWCWKNEEDDKEKSEINDLATLACHFAMYEFIFRIQYHKSNWPQA